MFKEVNIKDLKENFIKDITDEWMLVTAGDQNGYNMMTASWGFVGEMWNSECAVAMVRPQRYTMEFIKNSDYFTLSFYGDRKDIHKVCGSESGRDVNKTEKCGLTPVFSDNSVYFDEARLVIICKKQYLAPLNEADFTDSYPLQFYADKDYHYEIIGKIEKVLLKDDF